MSIFTVVTFGGQRREFESSKDAYGWLIQKFVQFRPVLKNDEDSKLRDPISNAEKAKQLMHLSYKCGLKRKDDWDFLPHEQSNDLKKFWADIEKGQKLLDNFR